MNSGCVTIIKYDRVQEMRRRTVPVFHRKPVLVPTDYSDASLAAIRVAKSIAGSDSDVTVVYVAQDHDLILHPVTWTAGSLPEYQEERLLLGLRNWSKDHDLGDINLKVRKGDPGTQVCELAEEIGSRLIVVPSHGRHGLQRLLMGSVAERIIRNCHCSVLVLRRTKGSESAPTPAADWLPRKWVVVPIDFSEASIMAIQAAQEVADDRSHIDVVSVVPTLDQVDFAGTGVVSDEVRRNDCEKQLQRYLTEHGFGSLRMHAFVGDPGTMIAEHASEAQADLIVIPSHGLRGLRRWVLGSTTERVIRHAVTPVLVLRPDVK
jgi:nucleotide-binding universal stress UspA family protein